MITQPPAKLDTPTTLVVNLIKQQFPQWSHLPIKPVAISGWDNKTFHLGDTMLIRLPSAQDYAAQVPKEHRWLPLLTQHLSVSIPKPLALGQPSGQYPFHWSVYQWIDGQNADTLPDHDLPQFAADIALFLNELHTINTHGAPTAGAHNYERGASPIVYDQETRAALTHLKNIIDVNAATALWENAINCSAWSQHPVWIHGDFNASNILVKNNRLAAVIDFGCMAIGDPACDLVIAWTFLNDESREIFKSHLIGMDTNTWARARGWCLWKSLITLAKYDDKKSLQASKMLYIINEILKV